MRLRSHEDIGTVYGVLLNDAPSVARRAAAFAEPPYRKPPVAPVLYIKPRNTFAASGATIAVPGPVRIDATIGVAIGRAATRVSAGRARNVVAGFVVVGDLVMPHDSVHRPAVRQRCRDGFCPIGVASLPPDFDPARAAIRIAIDGVDVHRHTLASPVRSLATLIEDVTAFMTLAAGDILLLGAPDDMPTGRPGQSVSIAVDGLDSLAFTLVAELA